MDNNFNTNNFSPKEDAVILDAIEYGHLSHARVEKLLNVSYPQAALFIHKVIEAGYFDVAQHPLISKNEYQKIIETKIGTIPPRCRYHQVPVLRDVWLWQTFFGLPRK